jgi:hypothetical protein
MEPSPGGAFRSQVKPPGCSTARSSSIGAGASSLGLLRDDPRMIEILRSAQKIFRDSLQQPAQKILVQA